METITTTFGSLRPWKAQDADALVKYANNRNISMNMRDGFAFPYTAENAKKFLDAAAQQDPATFYAIATPGRSHRRDRRHHQQRRAPADRGAGLLAGGTFLGQRHHDRSGGQVQRSPLRALWLGAHLCRTLRQQRRFMPGAGKGGFYSGRPHANERDQGRQAAGPVLIRKNPGKTSA